VETRRRARLTGAGAAEARAQFHDHVLSGVADDRKQHVIMKERRKERR
jgi:hypothetical protein